MKDFFDRHRARLQAEDLKRFGRILMEDLGAILQGYDFVVHLLDAPERFKELDIRLREGLARNRPVREAETGRIHLPVVHQNDPLAMISASSPPGGTPSGEVVDLLPTILRLSLDKVLMYKINVTDRETGLSNEDYFRAYIKRKIDESPWEQTGGPGSLKPLRIGDRDAPAGLAVLLVEIRDYDQLAADHGRLEARRALMDTADRLRVMAPPPCCLARLGVARLGLAVARMDLTAIEELARQLGLSTAIGGNEHPAFRLAMGLAGFPWDFSDDRGSSEAGDTDQEDLTENLLAKAHLALHQALTSGDPIFTFRQILHFGGRIVQVLPFQRVVVNLGRRSGARVGQVFIVSQTTKATEVDYKGEVVLFEVQEEFSLAQITNLRHSVSQMRTGDALVLSQTSAPPAGSTLDPLLGLPDHQGFIQGLTERMETAESFAVILVRVDGYDKYRTTMGHLESDRQFKTLADLLRVGLPEDGFMGRFSAESLALYWPGLDQASAEALCKSWRDHIVERVRQTCSFGLALYPRGPIERADMISCAQKAIEHAGFLGPASVAVFDSVSLNISGDKKFEVGEVEAAVEEYKLGLELDPLNANLLNSLGVCYGYRQQAADAMEIFDRVLALDPENLMAHYNRGFAMALAQRPVEALESFRRAAEIDGTNFDVLFQRGRTALELDLVDEALESFQRAARLQSSRPIVHRYLGQTMLRAERPEAAIDAFKAAVRHDPEDAASLSQLGALFLERKQDLDVALSLIRQAVALDTSNGLFRERLARALVATGNLAEAETQYRRALDLGVRTREVHYELGRVLLHLGRSAEAEACFRAALAVDPGFQPVLAALAGNIQEH